LQSWQGSDLSIADLENRGRGVLQMRTSELFVAKIDHSLSEVNMIIWTLFGEILWEQEIFRTKDVEAVKFFITSLRLIRKSNAY